MNARKRTSDNEYQLKLDSEIGSVYCSMEQYQEAVNILSKVLEIGKSEAWIWRVYLQLAKALCHTRGYYSNETLDAYLNCIESRRKFDVYGKGDLKLDIHVCHEISEIYGAKKNYVASNKWFRDEMLLRDACCDIGIKNKIKDLFDKAFVLANENHTEEALRQYEEAAYLIEKNISVDCDKYGAVQLEMGKLFWKGYASPRYDLALECFQKGLEIKRKYMSDLPKELFDSFSHTFADIKDFCSKSMVEITNTYNEFIKIKRFCNRQDLGEVQYLIRLRDATIKKCNAVLPLFKEVFQPDSFEVGYLYYFLGLSYKWLPVNSDEYDDGASNLKEAARIWKKYVNNKSVQTDLARLFVDLGGIYVMQNDYETALLYRLEALKTIKNVENADVEDVGQIELALKGLYGRTAQSKTMDYNAFLEQNGISTVIESVQSQPLSNGMANYKVKLYGIKEEYNWRMTRAPES